MEQVKKKIVWLAAFLAVGSMQVFARPFAVGPYLGQTPPGPVAQVFAPGLISHPLLGIAFVMWHFFLSCIFIIMKLEIQT